MRDVFNGPQASATEKRGLRLCSKIHHVCKTIAILASPGRDDRHACHVKCFGAISGRRSQPVVSVPSSATSVWPACITVAMFPLSFLVLPVFSAGFAGFKLDIFWDTCKTTAL